MIQIKSLVKIGLIAFILALTSALWAKYIATQWFASDASVELNTDFADKLNRLLPKRNEYVIPESGHLPHMENTAYFHDVLTTVLAWDD